MRLFAALRPSDEFRAALSELQNRLRAAGITGRYTEPFNFHMTLAFIGEWPADVTCFLPKIKHPFSIAFRKQKYSGREQNHLNRWSD